MTLDQTCRLPFHKQSITILILLPSLLHCMACDSSSPKMNLQSPPFSTPNSQSSSRVLTELGIPLPSRQLLDASPRLRSLQSILEQSSQRTRQVGADLAQLAWAQALAEVGALQEATTLALELSEDEHSTQLAALHLVLEIAPCDQGQEALKKLKKTAKSKSYPPPWDQSSLALAERNWAQRCNPGLLQKVNQKIAKHLPQLAIKLSLSIPKSSQAEQQLERALHLEANRVYPQAQALLEELMQRPKLSSTLLWQARYEHARIQIERIRKDYKTAAQTLDLLAKDPRPPSKKLWRDARLLAAKAWSKTNQKARAREVYDELIQKWEHSDEAKTARFMIAFSHYEAGEWRKAMKVFSPLCRHQGELKRAQKLKGLASRSGWTRASEWYYAWSLYQSSPHKAAPFLTYQVGEGLPTSEDARKAAYWGSKALDAMKQTQEAKALRTALIEGDPLDWYSLLIRSQFSNEIKDIEPIHLSKTPSPPQELSDPSYTDPLKRLLFVQNLGLNQLTQIEQSDAQSKLKAHLRSLKETDQLTLLNWARTAGLIELSLRTSVGLHPNLLKTIPTQEHGLSWQLAYPWSFQEILAQVSELEGISESTILSFIRKESAFQPRAESAAHALGLMQLLEKTAFSIATWEGGEPIPDLDPEAIELTDPKVNITLGARYLRALSDRYHGQLPLMAAGYNAGPANLNQWLQTSDIARKNRRSKNKVPLDLFVERVPFKEARLYIKRLLKTKCIYEILYGEQSLNQCAEILPLTLDTSIQAGVEF